MVCCVQRAQQLLKTFVYVTLKVKYQGNNGNLQGLSSSKEGNVFVVLNHRDKTNATKPCFLLELAGKRLKSFNLFKSYISWICLRKTKYIDGQKQKRRHNNFIMPPTPIFFSLSKFCIQNALHFFGLYRSELITCENHQ